MGVSDIVWIVLVAGSGLFSFRQLLEAAGGFPILRSPRVFLPLLAGAAGVGLSIVSAVLLDRLREGGFEGLSAPALMSGMFGGLLLAGSGAFLALAPNIRRQRRIDELSERLERLADPAGPLMVLASTPELAATRDQLVTYYRLLAGSPHPDLCDPERLARIQARIDLVDRSLRAAASSAGPAERA